MAATPEAAFTLDGDEPVPTSDVVHSPPPGQVAVEEAPGTTLSVLKSSSRRVADFIKGKADKVAESMQRIRPQRATDQSGSASPLVAPASEGPASPVASKEAVVLQEPPAPAPATAAAPLSGPASPPPGTAVPTATANVLQLDKLYAAAADLGKKTREGGVWAYHATAEGLRKLTTPARKLQVICRQELLSKPCPQVLLLACSLVATQGVTKPGIFRTEVPAEKLNALLLHLDAGMLLLPAECDAIVAAALIKHVLSNLDEPVLITSMAPRWIQAGNSLEVPVVAEALALLPVANATVLRLLVETCYRVALKSNITGMNALALAQQLAPLLLWKVAERPAMKAPAMPSLPAMGAPIQALKARLRGSSQPGAKDPAAEGAAQDKDATAEATDSSLVAPSTAVAEAGSALPPVSTTSVDYVGLSDASAAEAIGSPGFGSGAAGDEDSASKAAGGAGALSAAGGSVLGINDAASTAAATVAETDRAEPSDLDDADDAAARHSVVEEGEEVPEDGTDEGATEAAGGEHDAEEEGAAAAPAPGTKVLLTGAELDAVVRLTEHFILSFDELF